MLNLIGDIHGNFARLMRIVDNIPNAGPIIQVGDFGYWPALRHRYVPLKRPVYFIDGNHDDVGALTAAPLFDRPVELWPNAIYVPRGTVLKLDGKNVLFLGGAASVDRKYRAKNGGIGAEPGLVNAWFEEEVISDEDRERALASATEVIERGETIDVMVTHTPPKYLIDKEFGFPEGWGLPPDWRDPSADHVQDIWVAVDCPPLFCGHMHQSVVDGNVRILGIEEVYTHD